MCNSQFNFLIREDHFSVTFLFGHQFDFLVPLHCFEWLCGKTGQVFIFVIYRIHRLGTGAKNKGDKNQ